MQMILNTEIVSDKISGFNKASNVQNHFILFSADKDEQEIADDLIKKLHETNTPYDLYLKD